MILGLTASVALIASFKANGAGANCSLEWQGVPVQSDEEGTLFISASGSNFGFSGEVQREAKFSDDGASGRHGSDLILFVCKYADKTDRPSIAKGQHLSMSNPQGDRASLIENDVKNYCMKA